ncbi:MAG: 3-isopropylmalate dehydrogenase [Anaerolineaceae bacterium]|nr:3-isopropylmalate dehydrogenase [Anaerolineaceae bacterium]
MKYNIALVPGDGIGPEIVSSTVKVLDVIAAKFGHTFNFTKYLAGGCAIDEYGEPLPKVTVDGCLASDSVLLGAVGGPKWDHLSGNMRPEKALLGLRKALGLYTNLRPAVLQPALAEACVLRPDIAEKGFDLMIVRELTGGIYFGERGRNESGDTAFDTESYSVTEIERVARRAFEIARKRRKHLTSIDKANVLESSRLWRETVHRLGESEFPDVQLDDMYVDNAAMQIIRAPSFFDVIVTSNMFGDILSDEASQVTGSIGLLASASLGDSSRGMYEPIHGSAPDIAGKDLANPIATILSAAMMLRYSFDLSEEADYIEKTVSRVLQDGCRTADIKSPAEKSFLTGSEMTEKILAKLKEL